MCKLVMIYPLYSRHVAFLKIKTKMQCPFLSLPDFPSENIWNKGYFDQKTSPYKNYYLCESFISTNLHQVTQDKGEKKKKNKTENQ